jgi:FkbM family methyltransferase
MPLISVNIPLYNREAFIKACLDSVLQQTFTDFEVVVLDDASTDASASLVKSYQDPRIRYERNEVNLGISATRNRLVSLSRGTYIAVLDSDDLAEPDRLEKQLAAFQKDQSLTLVAGCAAVIDAEGQATGQVFGSALSPEACIGRLPFSNTILHSTVMARKSFLESFTYDAQYKSAEDYDVWLRGASAGHRFLVLPDILGKYRVHGSSESMTFSKEIQDNTLNVVAAHWQRLLGRALEPAEQQALGNLLYQKGTPLSAPKECFELLHQLHGQKVIPLRQSHALNKELYFWWRTAIYRLRRFSPAAWFMLRSPMLRQMPTREKAALIFKCILFKPNKLMAASQNTGKLVYDIGFHEGQDTAYYLKKGYRVVAVDADQALIARGNEQHAAAINRGQLTLVGKAIYEFDDREVEFFISDNSEWNSLNKDFAGRNALGTRIEKVATVRLDTLVRTYGKPYFLKIDIEGYDVHALRTLSPELAPDYISVEALSLTADHIPDEDEAMATLKELQRLGYRQFRLVDQTAFEAMEPGTPVYGVNRFAKEPLWAGLLRRFLLKKGYKLKRYSHRDWINARCGHQFEYGSAGPLPEELDGRWLDARTAAETLRFHLAEAVKLGMTGFWVDWHGRK